MDSVNQTLKNYLRSEFLNLLNKTDFFEWIDCHVEKRGQKPASYLIFDELQKMTTYNPRN